MRTYYPTRKRLKDKGKCTLFTAKEHRPRIIKAILKEKYKDLEYKFELAEQGTRAVLNYSVDEATGAIEFHLVIRNLIADINGI